MISLHDFAQRRAGAADAADDLAHALAAAGLGALAADLAGLADRTRRGRFHVLVIGVFSAGKSTLLNAIVGQPVLPAKVNPCTAVPTAIAYGDPPRATVHNADGTDAEYGLDEFLARFQLEVADTAGTGDRFAAVRRATVSVPLPLLRDGVVLLDTPGLDDDDQRTARTLAAIPEADAVIVVLNASRFLGDLERRLVRRELLPRGLVNLFFPVTMIDLLPALVSDVARARADLDARARAILGPLCLVEGDDRFDDRFFPLDARSALAARFDRRQGVRRDPTDEIALQQSGILAFERALERFLVEERGEAQIRFVVATLERARAEVNRRSDLDRAASDASVEVLRGRQAGLEPRFAELRAIAKRVERVVGGFVDRQKIRTLTELRAFMAAAEAELPDAIAKFDLGAAAAVDLLTARGRDRLESRLREQIDAWLAGRVAGFYVAESRRLGDAVEGLRVELAGEAADFDRELAAIVGDFGGVVTAPEPTIGEPEVGAAERWFAVAFGAALLSPATMAAGFSEGYAGALKGAAGRIGTRIAIVAIGALLGPIGWVGLLLYVVTDALVLVSTGGSQVRRVREQVATGLRGKLVAQVDARSAEIAAQVEAALAPLKDGIVGAARAEAEAIRVQLDDTIAERERTAGEARAREAGWQGLIAACDRAIGRVA